MAENICYIYGLKTKDTDYFYVGSTKHEPNHRLAQHLYNIRYNYTKNKHFRNKISQLGVENVVVEVIEKVVLDQRFIREYFWIEKIISDGTNLTNIIRSYDEYVCKFPVSDEILLPDDFIDKVMGFISSKPSKSSRLLSALDAALMKIIQLVFATPNQQRQVWFEEYLGASRYCDLRKQIQKCPRQSEFTWTL